MVREVRMKIAAGAIFIAALYLHIVGAGRNRKRGKELETDADSGRYRYGCSGA